MILRQAVSLSHANNTGRKAHSFDEQLQESKVSCLKLHIDIEANHLPSLHGQPTSHKTQVLLINLPIIYLFGFAPSTSEKNAVRSSNLIKSLMHFSPVSHFYTPWKRFQGVQKYDTGLKWVNAIAE